MENWVGCGNNKSACCYVEMDVVELNGKGCGVMIRWWNISAQWSVLNDGVKWNERCLDG